MRRHRWLKGLALGLFAVLAGGCDSEPVGLPEGATLIVVPANAQIVPGGSITVEGQVNLSWTTRASMPTARSGLGVAAANNGKVYAIGGTNGVNVANVEEYDPGTDMWATRTSMPTARSVFGVAAAGNGKIYAIGGNFPPLSTVEEYDAGTDTWATRASMPTARRILAAAAASNGKVYAVGGIIGLTSPPPTTGLLEEYDPGTDTWATRTSMPTARYCLAFAAASNGKLYAVGGVVPVDAFSATVEEYDPATNTWTTRANMPTARACPALVAASNGKLYAIGGVNSTGELNTVDEYDPATNTWTAQTSMAFARSLLGAAAASNGKLYAIGGQNGSAYLATNEEATANQPPVANAGGSYIGSEGGAVAFDGTGSSDADGDALTYAWDFGDGSPPGSGAAPSHTYADNGSFIVTLTVTDPSGATSTAATTATIANVAPSVSAIAGATILKGETFTGGGSFADPGADTWTATVDYGDGSGAQPLSLAGTAFSLNHAYGAAGTFAVTVTVTDDDGGVGAANATVIAQSPQEAAQSLSGAIADLVAAGALSAGNANALDAKLQAAIGQLNRGNNTAATNQLNAFINQVNALVGAGRLPADAGQILIVAANRIIASINAP